MYTLYIVLYSLSIFALIYLGILVAANKYHIKLNMSFLFLTISFSLWLLSNLFSNNIGLSQSLLLFINHLVLFFAGISLVFILLFSYYITDNNRFFTIVTKILILNMLIVSFLSLSSLILRDIEILDSVTALIFGEYAYIYFVSIILTVVYTVLLLAKGYYTSNMQDKLKLKILLVSVFITLSISVFTNLVIPVVIDSFYLTNLGPLSMLVLIFGFGYSIASQKLFVIKTVILRYVAYISLLLLIGTIYGLITFFVLNSIFFPDTDVSLKQEVLYTFSALLVFLLIIKLKKYFDKITNKIFFRDKYDPQFVINNINLNLASSLDLENVLTNNINIIEKEIKLEYADYYLDKAAAVESHIYGSNVKLFSNPKWEDLVESFDKLDKKSIYVSNDKNMNLKFNTLLDLLNIGCIIKMITDSKTVGYLVLGLKKNGTNYSNRDIQLFEIIADETAIAVQSHLRFIEIERFNETLQQNVKKATTDLQKSNEKLKSLDEAKDEFISMASHQLRTPLTSVKGYISMLLEGDAGPINDQQKTFLSQAFTSSQRMVYLIADLLYVSRLKTGKFVIEPSEVDLPQVVQTEVEQLQTTAAARGLTLKVDCPKDFPTLMLDETKIHQVIMNFIDNAIYYTPSGGSITVALNANKKSVELRVVDTGIGV
ncbi:MAG: Histidine kinase protein, partial [Patescibacteria group bacterium]|nr:Histidine kinase protein [Patescibacteria group bacterium]